MNNKPAGIYICIASLLVVVVAAATYLAHSSGPTCTATAYAQVASAASEASQLAKKSGQSASGPAAAASAKSLSRGATAATTQAAEEYPPQSLVAACQKKAAALRERLDDSFIVLVQPPFVVAGNMSREDLEVRARASITRPAEAMWKAYFLRKPDQVITTLLFTDEGAQPPEGDRERGYVYRAWAKKLFGDRGVSYYGYYRPGERTMVMNIDTGGGTLVHELTHALIVYDFPQVPDWFNEGLGSLHEQCQIAQDDVIGLPNWRLPALQRAIHGKTLRPLKELITQDNFRDARLEGMNYAQARYFVMYAQKQGLLKKLYVYLRDHRDDSDVAVAGVEKLFGKKVEDVEKDYLAWVKTLRFGR